MDPSGVFAVADPQSGRHLVIISGSQTCYAVMLHSRFFLRALYEYGIADFIVALS